MRTLNQIRPLAQTGVLSVSWVMIIEILQAASGN